MPFDAESEQPEPPLPWPPKGMWCNKHCEHCKGVTAVEKGGNCHECGRDEYGQK